jgi:hypothetical protein
MVFRPALRSSKAMFRPKASVSRVFLLLDFDHRRRIQIFRAREYAFKLLGAGISSDRKNQTPIVDGDREVAGLPRQELTDRSLGEHEDQFFKPKVWRQKLILIWVSFFSIGVRAKARLVSK